MRPTPIILSICVAFVGCTNSSSNTNNTGKSGQGSKMAKSEGMNSPGADQVRAWNALVLATAQAEDKFLTLKGLRTATMMHVAMHDALNAIEPKYAHYTYKGEGKGADPMAAIAQAAYEVASSQFTKPEQKQKLDAELSKWLGMAKDEAAKTKGVEIGKAAAMAILKKRESDGWNTQVEYKWHPMAPGVYAEFNEHSGTPKGFIFGAAWAKAMPFALEKPGQFRAPPPPDIKSAEYTKAYDEVKEVGWDKSTTRTKDQTHLANWWKDFCENSINRLGRHITTKEKLGFPETVRFFALINISLYDAYVSIFENKFHYNHWRPYTAIRWAKNDENPDTKPDPKWDNTHHHTYAFPSYPSAHGTACAAMFSVYESYFGENYKFTMTTKEVNKGGPFSPMMAMDPPTRSFNSFDEAAMECAMSRVYLGIHFRYDSVEGNKFGKKVGEYVLSNYLKPL